MRGKPILAGLLGLTAIAACGLPPTAHEGAPVRASGPGDPARRYQVLIANPLCTPTPTVSGTGTPAPSCDAFAGRGGSILFSVVDRSPGFDLGQVQFDQGDFLYLAGSPDVEQATDMFSNPIIRISASFNAIYTGPPIDPEPTADGVFATITINLNGFTYTIDAEESEFDEAGDMQVLLTTEDSCTLIPVQNLFPQPE